jgi:hypothetical protein
LIFVGEFVEDVVLGFVEDLNWIEVWVFGEELVDFREIAAFKKNPLDFFLLVLWEHWRDDGRAEKEWMKNCWE